MARNKNDNLEKRAFRSAGFPVGVVVIGEMNDPQAGRNYRSAVMGIRTNGLRHSPKYVSEGPRFAMAFPEEMDTARIRSATESFFERLPKNAGRYNIIERHQAGYQR